MSKVKFEDLQKIFLFRRSGRQVQKLRASPNWDVTVPQLQLRVIRLKMSVSNCEISEMALTILPKLGMELEGDELGTVTEPDFPKKFWIIQKSRKRVFADFAISDGFFLEI